MLGALCLAVGLWMLSATGFGVYLFGLSLDGVAWGLVSCLVGVLVTAPRARVLAEADAPTPAAPTVPEDAEPEVRG